MNSHPPSGLDAEATIATVAHALLPSPEQQELAGTLRSLLGRRSSELAVRAVMETDDGFDSNTWNGLINDLGIVGLAAPESVGGAGAGFAEVLIVAEELGRSLSCVPWLSSVVLAQTLLGALPPKSEVEELLGQVASGEVRAAVAFVEEGSLWNEALGSVTITQSPSGWTVSGRKRNVIDGHTADVIIVVVRTGDTYAVLAADGKSPDLNAAPLPTMDLTRKQANLDFDRVPAILLAEDANLAFEQMLGAGAAALAAESLGGARFVLESATQYAKTRFQFGRAIGSFQAIKHKCADMLIAVEGAGSALSYARATATGADSALRPMAYSIAKITAGEAFMKCAAENIQIHGGIGFTWEHSAHLYYKRARANSLMFGTSREHRSAVADLLSL